MQTGGGCLCLLIFGWLIIGNPFQHSGAKSTDRRCSLDAYDAGATAELDLKKCDLAALPASISRFSSLVKLDVSNNPALHDFPDLPPSITTLFALGTGFTTIPPAVAALPALRMLSFKSAKLRDLGMLALPASLQWLILTDNQLTSVPSSIGRLTRMRKFMLANNELDSLPASMANMLELELLRISNNRLTVIPNWLHKLPKLTWLAIAGNPCVASAPARASLPTVSFSELSLGQRLGEGTSSVVRKGEWHSKPVAVKLYKSALSSDGRNIDEVRASCAVDHENVLRWLGFVAEGGAMDMGHGGAAAAAMGGASGVGGSGSWKLVGLVEWAPGFASLGKPPSMDTVTRDTYPAGTQFTGGEIHDIAVGIAAAMQHLHSRGLAHGDLYAHNILWKRAAAAAAAAAEGSSSSAAAAARGGGRGHGRRGTEQLDGAADGAHATAKLSDFGAAFYYGAEHAVAYERMEQRAYGFLLEELLERHDGSEPRMLPSVRAAATAATATAVEERPGFAALLEMLTTIKGGGGGRRLRPRGTFGRVLPSRSSLADAE